MLLIFKIFYFLIFIFVSYGLNAQDLKFQENYFYQQLVALNKKNNLNIIMSNQDIKKYKNIFDLQKEGKWKKAKNIIDTLDNDILLGHENIKNSCIQLNIDHHIMSLKIGWKSIVIIQWR